MCNYKNILHAIQKCRNSHSKQQYIIIYMMRLILITGKRYVIHIQLMKEFFLYIYICIYHFVLRNFLFLFWLIYFSESIKQWSQTSGAIDIFWLIPYLLGNFCWVSKCLQQKINKNFNLTTTDIICVRPICFKAGTLCHNRHRWLSKLHKIFCIQTLWICKSFWQFSCWQTQTNTHAHTIILHVSV